MALLDLKAEVESLPQGCHMTWRLRLNPYPSALAIVGVQHGLPGFCYDFAMVGHAPSFFSIGFDGGGWVAFHLFSLFCAAWFTFVFDGGGAAGHINKRFNGF